MDAQDNELWISAISIWEAFVLAEKGRLILDGDHDAWFQQALSIAPLKEAPITIEVVRVSRSLLKLHKDPADRFIASTAKVLDLTLITSNDRLLGSKEFSTLANR